MHDNAHPVAFRGELVECVLVSRSGVDDQRLGRFASERDVRGERTLLIGTGGRAIAVEVKAGLTDGDTALVRCQSAQLGQVGVVEALGGVGVAANGGVHLREVLSGCKRSAAGEPVDTHGEHARDAHPLGGTGRRVKMGIEAPEQLAIRRKDVA